MKEIRYRDLVKILQANGAVKVRTVGSHETWRVGNCQTVVPHHVKVAPGTLRSIRDHLAPCLGRDWLGQ
jgi:predicted RNA binding protein YcfA (HicA-like mRNA interferase family)